MVDWESIGVLIRVIAFIIMALFFAFLFVPNQGHLFLTNIDCYVNGTNGFDYLTSGYC